MGRGLTEDKRPRDVEEEQGTLRIGKVGELPGKWDNGMYTLGYISGVPVNFLVDTGSTCTLLSKEIYDRIRNESGTELSPGLKKIQGVNGSNLRTFGSSEMEISLGNATNVQRVIVSDITPEGILGQDFLLKNVRKIDYTRLVLHTKSSEIQCWVGGEAEMVCRIEVKEEITIPSNSGMWVPVKIPQSDHISRFGYVEGSELITSLLEKKHTHGTRNN